MLTEVCKFVNNYFEREMYPGTYTIKDGSLEGADELLQHGQYFRIIGSVFNDAVHCYGFEDLTDETFTGAVWALAIPKDFLKLVEDIEAFEENNTLSPYTSESFAGYSYSKATNSEGMPVTYKDVFRSNLNRWRKL